MAITIPVRRNFKVEGVLTDVTTAKLSDPTGTYGIKKNSDSSTVVADATAMTKLSTGVYEYDFTTAEEGVAYTAYVEFVYAGNTYHIEHDIAARTTATFRATFTSLQTEIADFLGWKRNSEGTGSDWSGDEINRLGAIIKSALKQVYYPASVAREGQVHQWSFMRPVATLTTSAPYTTGTVTIASGVVTLAGGTFPSWAANGELAVAGGTYTVASRDSDTQITLDDLTVDADALTTYSLGCPVYDLPSGFGGFAGGSMTFLPGQAEGYGSVTLVQDLQIRARRQQNITLTDRPQQVAVRPKTFDATTGQRWQAIFYPTPNAAYDLRYQYIVEPAMLDATNVYPLGGPEVGELILSACLAIAEERYLDGPGPQGELLLQRLKAAVASDAQAHSPDFLGYNADHSDKEVTPQGIRHDGLAVHSFEGTYYYDQNP